MSNWLDRCRHRRLPSFLCGQMVDREDFLMDKPEDDDGFDDLLHEMREINEEFKAYFCPHLHAVHAQFADDAQPSPVCMTTTVTDDDEVANLCMVCGAIAHGDNHQVQLVLADSDTGVHFAFVVPATDRQFGAEEAKLMADAHLKTLNLPRARAGLAAMALEASTRVLRDYRRTFHASPNTVTELRVQAGGSGPLTNRGRASDLGEAPRPHRRS